MTSSMRCCCCCYSRLWSWQWGFTQMIVSSVHFIEFACVLISVFSPFFANHHQHHCYNILRPARHLKAINDFTVHQIMAPQKFHAESITQMHNQSFIFMEKKKWRGRAFANFFIPWSIEPLAFQNACQSLFISRPIKINDTRENEDIYYNPILCAKH